LQLNYLEAIENTVNEVSRFLYVIHFDNNNSAIGKSVFQLLKFDASNFDLDSIPCRIQNKILRIFLKRKLKILISGNIFATGENAFHFVESVHKKDAFYFINMVIDTLFKKKEINYAIYKEYSPKNTATTILTKYLNYYKFNIDANMVFDLKVNWQEFNEILSEYNTKYRTRINKVLEKSKQISVKEFTTDDINKYANDIERLYNAVIKKSNFNVGIFKLETFYSLKDNLNSNYRIYGYFINDKLIGFKSLFHYNGNLDASFIGLDYKVNKTYDLYQRMLIDYIKFGLKHKVNSIGFGRTAETIKSCVGAEPIAMNLFVKHRRKFGRIFLKYFISNINPTEFSIRKPFKKQYYN
jgi:hypothetical protein